MTEIVAKASSFFHLHDKQKEAYQYIGSGKKIFYGGAKGGGKSHFCRVAAMQVCKQFPGIRVVIVRHYFSELEELFISRIQADYPAYIFEYSYKDSKNQIWFENGSKIIFRACESPKDALKIKGLEYEFMIIDEANETESDIIELWFTSLRSSKNWAFEPTVLMTGNPGGVSDAWFKHHFIKPDFRFWNKDEIKYKDDYVFVFANVYDNPSLNKGYIKNLETLSDPNRRKAYLFGDWDTFSGQFFTDWSPDVHVCESFDIPRSWFKVFGMDLGYGGTADHPTAAYWAAQDPRTQNVYVYREYIGRGSVEQYIQEIKNLQGNDNVSRYFGDPAMFDNSTKRNAGDESPGFMFMREGINLEPANNNRILGWQILKQWLHWTGTVDENEDIRVIRPPKLMIFDICHNLAEAIPRQKYDHSNRRHKAEDLDTKGKDDEVDALRYLIVSGFLYPTYVDEEIIEERMIKEKEKERLLSYEAVLDRFIYGTDAIEPEEEEEIGLDYTKHFVTARSYFG